MELVERLDLLKEKISQLIADNERLSMENQRLQGEVARIIDEYDILKSSSSQIFAERDEIKERVERLIEMIGA
jgi:regulator of replication initiation timing